MNWDHIKAKWTDTKGELKAKWGKLTDDDLKLAEGKWDQLVARLRDRYGYSKDEAEREVDGFLRKIDARKPSDGEMTDQPPRH